MVIHYVFSGSDVGSKWRLLYSLLHPTTKHLNRLGVILVYICSGSETMADWWQLTQGGSEVRHQSSLCWNTTVNQTIVGGAWIRVTSHWQASDIGSIWERGKDFSRFKKKKHWVDFYHYRVVVYTHCQHTFQFKQRVKVHVASYDPFNTTALHYLHKFHC